MARLVQRLNCAYMMPCPPALMGQMKNDPFNLQIRGAMEVYDELPIKKSEGGMESSQPGMRKIKLDY